MNYREEYQKWLSCPVFDEETKSELKNIKDESEIEDRFYKNLAFGTGGLRGVIGAGNNRMNVYTVGKASQGLAEFIKESGKTGGVVIAFDSRRMSAEFAKRAALVFAANGVKAYLFESLRPTPELSFAVRYLNAAAGVVITASHNPPEYNGYKVYWSDGGQIVPPYDSLIIEKVNGVSVYEPVNIISEEEAEKKGLLEIIGEKIDDAFIAEIKKLVLNREICSRFGNRLKIVYTPLNGTGNIPVRRILKELGFNNVYTVKEQEAPDGDFPTLKSPNPEDPSAFELAIKLAKEKNADIIIATDPDADRLGVYIADGKGSFVPLTGNVSGLLIAEYIISQKKQKGLIDKNPKDCALITTVVSSKMGQAMCESYGLTYKEVLTGFKYIGEQIKIFEENKEKNGGKYCADKGAYRFVFGFEESYGCLTGIHARDKDAVCAAAALAEAAAYYKSKGVSLSEQVENLYRKYGYYKEALYSLTVKGAAGARKIAEIIENLRNGKTEEIGGLKVLAKRDYLIGKRTEREGGETLLTLPKSNIIYYELDGGWCCVRPSGTEPKIKFYAGVKAESAERAEEKLLKVKESLLSL